MQQAQEKLAEKAAEAPLNLFEIVAPSKIDAETQCEEILHEDPALKELLEVVMLRADVLT